MLLDFFPRLDRINGRKRERERERKYKSHLHKARGGGVKKSSRLVAQVFELGYDRLYERAAQFLRVSGSGRAGETMLPRPRTLGFQGQKLLGMRDARSGSERRSRTRRENARVPSSVSVHARPFSTYESRRASSILSLLANPPASKIRSRMRSVQPCKYFMVFLLFYVVAMALLLFIYLQGKASSSIYVRTVLGINRQKSFPTKTTSGNQ